MTTFTVLTNWTVYFNDNPTVDGGSNQIRWTGGAGTTDIQDLYSALQDEWDNVTGGAGNYVSFGVPMQSVTPTAFRIGQIFSNEPDSWFIDPESIKHLTGGGLATVGWNYVIGTRKGIFKVPMSSLGTIVAGDVGFTASNGTVTGTLLYVDTNNNELWIRPTDSTATHDWNTVSSGTVSVNGHSGTQGAAGTTGNSQWSNIFTIGTIVSGTQLYIAQDQSIITNAEDSGAGLWWGTGQLDVLINTVDQGTTIDNAYLTVYARKENELHDHFVSLTSPGGRTPVPLSTGDDLNNETVGAIAANGITISYAGPYTADVNNDTVNENYSIQINCANNPLSDVYEYLKYITRRGSATSLNGLTGDIYIGIDNYIEYTGGVTGTVNIGDEVTGSTSGATGYVINLNTGASPTYVTLGNSQGDFQTGENLAIGGSSINTTSLVTPVSSTKQSVLGTFAGGRYFGPFGVYLTNVAGADLNNYQVIADDGVTYQEPIQVSFTLTGIQTDSEVRIYNDDLTTTRNTEITGTENSESTLRSIVIQNGGSGYNVSDTLTLVGGTFTSASTINVDAVDGGGAITAASVLSPGEGYTTEPTAPTSTTGGTGAGAAFIGTYRGDFTYTYTYSTDINITIVIFNLFAKEVRLLGLQLTDQNQSIPIQQITERNYLVGSV